jgi:urea transport system ATP-binding protein
MSVNEHLDQRLDNETGPDAIGAQGPSYGRVAGEGLDTTHGAILYLEEITVSFDGFRALNKLSLDISVGELRCIIGPERRRQDDHDGRHHRQDAADLRHGVLRPDHGPEPHVGAPDRACWHRPQVPAADGVRAAHGVREPGTGDEDRQARAADLFARLSSEQRGKIDEILKLIRLNGSEQRLAGCCRTGRSSGWKSACC